VAKTWKTLLIYRIMDHEIERCARAHLRGRLLDIGCGTKPYEAMLAPYVDEHVGLDREQPFNPAARVDLVGTAYEIPAPDASFDCAISTAALEHLNEPEQALRECFRVLKPGGAAVYTVPLIWHVHAEPYDFYRYTEFGLRYLFGKAGFEVVEVRALSGFWTTFATLFCYYLERFMRGPLRRIPIIPAFGVLLQGIAMLLDRIDRAERWTWMYSIVARKPPQARSA
jgi:SAM-dependent methyltransferase